MAAPVAPMPRAAEALPAKEGRYLLDSGRFLGPLLLLPTIIYIVALVGFPLVLAIAYAFSDVTVATTGGGLLDLNWVGFDNFRAAWNDKVFQTALRNTLLFTLVTQVAVVV